MASPDKSAREDSSSELVVEESEVDFDKSGEFARFFESGQPDEEGDMWAMETGGADCDCPGPPPEFLLPPPPRPPFLQDPIYCSEDPIPDIETCDALPLIDASYRSSPSFQTSAVIAACSLVLGLVVFVIIIIVWKHKRKVQNLLPCKNSPQNQCDGTTAAGVIYEDLSDVIPRHTTPQHHAANAAHIVAPSIEMIDVKSNIHYPSGYPMAPDPPVFLCPSPGPDPYCSQDLYNPVYEELSDADSDLEGAPGSEDEFAEDELSLAGDAERRLNRPPPPYRPEPPSQRNQRFRRQQEPLPPIPMTGRRIRSLERQAQEFHEGMLLDALLQYYPRIGTVGPQGRHPSRTQMVPSITQRVPQYPNTPGPYESVPVLGHLATFRPVPKPYSQDSAFGSDSGYSNHTSGTRGSNRGRSNRDPRRLSQLSADIS